ncbi:hypothetical protein GCM10011507_10220 [Edaphobacter acidisoli]|uniref:Uncharacterized protein n=1 Tax=Edaphobacter acidisoli TaxID=2040573 RepID=A0A916W1Y6_9BACT|nr:hypothetical protein GCM10011507_10220 [Edaphobacter acidisoli]
MLAMTEFDPEQGADEKSFENCCDTWWDTWWLLLLILFGVAFVWVLVAFAPVG